MPTLKEIQQPVERHLAPYEAFLRSVLRSDSEYAGMICNYVLSNRGKQMRPLLVLLSAALNGEINANSYCAAALAEIVHTTSLIHDDVVDGADTRRGAPSVNALWRSKTAVLVGDYLLARAFGICMESPKGFEMAGEITRSVGEMSEGELIQTDQADKLRMTEELYFSIIRKKTAELLGACAVIGAVSVDAPKERAERMRGFGLNLGIAFQIRDDVLDYSAREVTGKPSCGDLRERKITLPLLYILDNVSPEKREALLDKLRRAGESPEALESLRDAVVRGGGLEYATRRMEEFRAAALACLGGYPDSEIRRSLEKFAEFTLAREK